MKLRRILSLVLILCLAFTFVSCKKDNEVSDERKETLLITGLWWGAPNNFNHLSGWSAFPCNMNSNHLLYETMFMYNNMTEELEPLLAKSYEWVDELTVEIKMNDKAKFSDGVKLTAHDVVYTFDLGNRYDSTVWSGIWENIDSIEAIDDYTVRINANPENNLQIAIEEAICKTPIHPKHVWESIEEEYDYDQSAITEFFNPDPIGSGPYKIDSYDDTKITVVRNDDYWGVDVFGKLPAPKYITHLDYASNDVATVEFEKGIYDYSENYIPEVWNLNGFGETIKTYLPKEPYYTNDTAPTIYLNQHKPGLKEVEVRRALAHAIDYDKIAETAMNGYSIPIEAGLFVNTAPSRALVDMGEIKDLQWSYDIDKANEILDSIGAIRGDDGIRVLEDGTRLGPWKVTCPAGWTEWNVALEVVSQSAKEAGIEIVVDFPDWGPYFNSMTTGEFDLIMNTPAAFVTPANPWKAYNEVLYSVGVPEMGEMAFWNYGRYQDDRADEIIEAIPHASENELVDYYTELNQIYLRDVPAIGLMYRPVYYYTVNESIWKNFPQESDGTPAFFFDGAGIRGLYNLENK